MNISTNTHIKLFFALILAIIFLATTNARSFADDGAVTAQQAPITETVLAAQPTADDSVEEPKVYNALQEQESKAAPTAVLVRNLSVNGSAPSHLLSLSFIITALIAIYCLSAPRFND